MADRVTASAPAPRVSADADAVVALAVEIWAKSHEGTESVIAIQHEPGWDGPPEHADNGSTLRFAPCGSVLAVLAALADHAGTGGGAALVVLTPLAERELGDSILARCVGRRVFPLDRSGLVHRLYGVSRLDPRLLTITWMADALIAASPYPTVGGGTLTRDAALTHLANRWVDLAAPAIDLAVLLDWPPSGRARYGRLPGEQRLALRSWLAEMAGAAAEPLLRTVDADGRRDPLAVGVVCAALWLAPSEPDADIVQARGRAEILLGGPGAEADAIRAFGAAAQDRVAELLGARDPAERQRGEAVLGSAMRLLDELHAVDAARHSTLLPVGFDHRLGAVARELGDWLATRDPDRLVALAGTVAYARSHAQARPGARYVERAEMALRLCRWLASPTDEPHTVEEGLAGQVSQWGWVDRALAHIYAGDPRPALAAAYLRLYEEIRERRRALDAAFAGKLAAWTSAGGDPGSMLIVERLLEQVVAPVARAHPDRALLIVLDGMSAAIAAELAEQITARSWVEIGQPDAGGAGRRRGVAAALPTVTKVSRTSLFAAALCSGDQNTEKKTFPDHPFWGHGSARLTAQLYHKGSIPGAGGSELSPELQASLADRRTVVAVVLNAIDEALVHGRDASAVSWRLEDIRELLPLLDAAAGQGRAIVLASDHGHIWERGTQYRPGGEPRYRTDRGDAAADEVVLEGPRVGVSGNRIVAPWSEDVRYAAKATGGGYHGGAALAEVTIPLLVFVPPGHEPPAGWAEVPDPTPAWWRLDQPPASPTTPAPAVLATKIPSRRRAVAPGPGQETLAIGSPPARAAALTEALLGSEIYAAQKAPLRRLADAHVRVAVSALVDAGGQLAKAELARRCGLPPSRAGGLVSMLVRLLNVDGYPVLEVVDDDRSVRLSEHLLRQQFGLGGTR
ncbi:MAG: BREX-2 system phosphatase PglZ [Sporichthyaceae bacterium]|nr:BREX-2 system phosphatase PglZ [Sporichthyaceae bacterium]